MNLLIFLFVLIKDFLKSFIEVLLWCLVVVTIEVIRLIFFPEVSRFFSLLIFLCIFSGYYWIKEKIANKNRSGLSLSFLEVTTFIHVVKEDIGNFKVFDAFLVRIEKTLVPMTVLELKSYILNRKGDEIDPEYLKYIEEPLSKFDITVLDGEGEDIPQGTIFVYITNRTK